MRRCEGEAYRVIKSHFHECYDCYCYLPLYIFCGEELLCTKLRRSNIDASEGTVPEAERIVERIRQKWPEAEIILRADSGFARERIMKWCEKGGVDYVFGLAQNSRLKGRGEGLLAQVEKEAEHLTDKANPRFIVSSLSEEEWGGKDLYEDLYCERGEAFEISKHYPKKGLFAKVLSRLQAARATVAGATA